MDTRFGERRFFLVDIASNTIVNSCWTTESWHHFTHSRPITPVAGHEWHEFPPSTAAMNAYDDEWDRRNRF